MRGMPIVMWKTRNARQVRDGVRNGLARENVLAHRVVNFKGFFSGAGYFETWDLKK